MWKKWFALGCICWEDEKENQLMLIFENKWIVKLNGNIIKDFESKETALKYVEGYINGRF